MNIQPDTSRNLQSDDLINAILKALEVGVNQLKDNVNLSQQMLDMGVDTDLSSQIKNMIGDPLSHLLKTRDEINSSIGSLITLLVKGFFNSRKEILSQAFITDNKSNNEIHFSIILKNDNYENRESIFTFLTEYKNTPLWESYPLYFQIVPESVSDKIPKKEILFEN